MKRILVTGAAGFIGYNLCLALLKQGHKVLGLDNLNDYYDVGLKKARLAQLEGLAGFQFYKGNLASAEQVQHAFLMFKPGITVNLAAQAGVRYSITNPIEYGESNMVGFLNILEACRHTPGVQGLIYASSSSVYGGNTKVPFSVEDRVDQPISLYAASKKSNELMANVYSHLFGMHTTGLRFFTVYGPWGRPDMAYYSFTKAIFAGEPIRVFNHGKMRRDFTYIDDIVAGILAAIERNGRCEIFNLGNNRPVELGDLIRCIEQAAGRPAKLVMEAMQPGDVLETWADIETTREALGYHPITAIEEGIPRFVEWFRNYSKLV